MRFLYNFNNFNAKTREFVNNKLKLDTFLYLKKKTDKKIKISKKKALNVGIDGFFPNKKWKMAKKVIAGLIIAFAFEFIGFAAPGLAQSAAEAITIEPKTQIVLHNGAVLTNLEAELIQKGLILTADAENNFNSLINAKYTSFGVRTITAYNSEAAQTDDSPCITANGFNVCKHGVEDSIAANFLKFGARVKIPDLFGNRIFVVRDRMSAKYSDRVDVWMINKQDSKEFGVRRAEIQVIVD